MLVVVLHVVSFRPVLMIDARPPVRSGGRVVIVARRWDQKLQERIARIDIALADLPGVNFFSQLRIAFNMPANAQQFSRFASP